MRLHATGTRSGASGKRRLMFLFIQQRFVDRIALGLRSSVGQGFEARTLIGRCSVDLAVAQATLIRRAIRDEVPHIMAVRAGVRENRLRDPSLVTVEGVC